MKSLKYDLNAKVCKSLSIAIVTALLLSAVECQRGGNRRRVTNEERSSFNAPVIFPDDRSQPNSVVRDATTSSSCKNGICQSPNTCFSRLANTERVQICRLPNGANGICCGRTITVNSNEVIIRIIPSNSNRRRNRPEREEIITVTDINNAVNVGIVFMRQLDKFEVELREKKLLARTGTQENSHQNFFGANPVSVKMGRDGMIGLQAMLSLAREKNLSPAQTRGGLQNIDISNSIIRDFCPKEPPCSSGKYRTPDGSCNNRINKSWGKSMTAFNRILSPDYSDGVNELRVATDGRPLPSAREVSLMLAPDRNEPSQRYTLMVMQFGQFVDHDLDLTASTRTNDNSAILCCGEQFQRNPRLLHPACQPISIPREDPFFGRLGQTCMNFVRSAPAPREECKLGPREQLNQITSYLDASNIYGSSAKDAANLRLFRGGRLRASTIHNREFLPFSNVSNFCSLPSDRREKCFSGGDTRVNENIDLVTINAVWLREHNRVAGLLSQINPQWNDEILYQESRRIVAAEMQHIVFNEFLPIILGPQVMELFGLTLLQNGFSDNYSPEMNAGITSAFATAAYRFHTLIPASFNLLNENNRVVDTVDLPKQFDTPELLYREGAFDLLLNGLTGQPLQHSDNFFTSAVTHHLFQPTGSQFGLDLVSLNIQRGRDHGLPGYNSFREVCGLDRVTNFEGLESIMNPTVARAMSRLYRNVNDIDLFIAGVSENHIRGALVGPTFACIIAEQFRRLKNGDRFWYENGGQEGSFTEDQLREIKKASLARILCDNSDGIKSVQPLAMVQPFNWNPKVSCDNENIISRLNLRLWQNEPVF